VLNRFPRALLILLAVSPVAVRLSAQQASTDSLTTIILRQDSLLFAAFNGCDTTAFARFFAPDVEFYHDKTGLTRGREANVALIAARCRDTAAGKAPRLHRTLVPGSVEVYPVPGIGAMQIGRHRFEQIQPGASAPSWAEFGFLHVWRLSSAGWELIRIMSYGH
jgi:hypothetical protein